MTGRIERIELWHVNVPLTEPFWPSWIPGYPQTHVAQTYARFVTSDGLTGETAGPAFTTERRGLGDLLGGFLLGMAADDMDGFRKRHPRGLVPRLAQLVARGGDVGPRRQDGRQAGLQAAAGARADRVARARLRLERLAAAARGAAPATSTRSAAWASTRSRSASSTTRSRRILRIVRGVRAAVGDDFTIGVDANQGWPVSLFRPNPDWDLERATAFARGCDELGIAWLEEPLDMHDWHGMAELRRRVRTTIAGGELHGGWHELQPLFEHDSLGKYQPDAMFCGLTVSKRVMQECRRRGLMFSPHTWSNGFNMIVNLHAFAAWEHGGHLEYPYEPPGFVPAAREGIMPPLLANADGTLDVPQSPGLGLQVDERLLRRYGKRFHVSTPTRVALHTIREKGLKAALQLKRAKEGGPTASQ